MTNQNFSSKLLENAVGEFAKLPGIGAKTALRLVLHLLKQDQEVVNHFGNSLIRLKSEIKYCSNCYNLSDSEVCDICADTRRDKSLICVVESIRDVMSIENTQQFKGVYHVLGGIISPMEGIGPADLTITELEKRVEGGDIAEVILALSATLEADTTNYYIYKKLKKYGIPVSTLARGVAFGDELEYTDAVTLGRSITNRTPFENTLGNS
ncbi:MAG TPA: recombination mediator RecR [Bacteroidales bacterium]|nr:recombination mediator RecR [Bacteroidales bacterium]